jgi:polyphenol oxidase
MFYPADIFASFPQLVACQSTRHGGVSAAPYHSLNLGWSTDDAPENAQENRRRFFTALGFDEAQTASSHQVHGAEVLTVVRPGRYDGYDALITQEKDLLLNVSVADCTPILIFDSGQEAVAAVHAGWKGTTLGIVSRTLEKMQVQFGTAPKDCYAHIGACIDGCDYEVDEDVAGQFDPAFAQWDSRKGKYLLDLKAANRAQLLASGLRPERIEVSPFSTVTHNSDFFSHRFEKGLTGRMLAAIGIKGIYLPL